MLASYVWFSTQLSRLTSDRRGQGLAEYALILALIAIVAIIALIFLGSQVSRILNTVGKSVYRVPRLFRARRSPENEPE